MLLKSENNTVTLAEGITTKEVREASLLFIKSMREIGKKCDEICIAHALIIRGQKAWDEGGKGHTKDLEQWMCDLYEHNKTFFDRAKGFIKNTLGIDCKIVRKNEEKADEGFKCEVQVLKDRDLGGLKTSFEERVKQAHVNGITYHPDAKVSVPKKSAKGKGKNGDAETKTEGQIKAEDSGLTAAIEGGAKDLDEEVMKLMAQFATLYASTELKQQARGKLSSAIDMMRKGLTLDAAVTKKEADAA